MTKDEYIDAVISRISSKREMHKIRQELNDHIEDRIEYYTDAGFTEEDANAKAMQRMGNPDDVGKRLDKLHSDDRFIWLTVIFAGVFIMNTIICHIVGDYDFGVYDCICIVINYMSYGLSYYYAYKSDLKFLFIPLYLIAVIFGFLFYCYFIPYFEYTEIESGFQYDFLMFVDLGFCALVVLTIIVSIIYVFQDKKAEYALENKFIYTVSRSYFKFLLIFVIAVSVLTIGYTVNDFVEYRAYIQQKISTQDEDFVEAENVMNLAELPMTYDDASELALSLNIDSEEAKSDLDWCSITLCENNNYYISLNDNEFPDDNANDLFEKIIFISYKEELADDEQIKVATQLKKNATLDDFYSIIPMSDVTYIVIECNDGKNTVTEITIGDYEYEFTFYNGIYDGNYLHNDD